jgi:hypothetical protein
VGDCSGRLASRRIRPALCISCLVLLVVAACGGGGDGGGGVALTVTRDFGRVQLDSVRLDDLPDGATARSLLRDQTGRSAGGEGWTLFVNGVRPDEPDPELHEGDRVQWDRRPRGPSQAPTRAIVGSFPEPFRHGLGGERRPVRVECEDARSQPCKDAKRALEDVDVPVSGASIGAPGTEHVTRLVVATWQEARIVRGASTLEQTPDHSGVYARFSANGAALELLDDSGQVARIAPPGTGLVVALQPRADELVWLVTALDERGLTQGVKALRERALRDAYAVAVEGGRVTRLPL